ncbi:YtxH domain-containing protein [Paenibacillus chitinolyticus]|uniref:YtxH domain-containing protein n=1 Tax=Paenibacillus chitinolyticus TaxID=79263 RepID=UPI003557BE82
MASEKRNKDLLVGAVIGGVLGAVTALLFAPKSRRELRSDLKEGYHQVSEKTQQIAGDVAEKLKRIVSAVSEKAQTAAESIGRTKSEMAGKAKLAAAQVGQEVKSWHSSKPENATDDVAAAEASIATTTVEREEH